MLALLAQATLWLSPPRRLWPRLILSGFSLSWIDLTYHTLSITGLNISSFVVRASWRAEAYNALVRLGVPGKPLLVGIAVLSALLPSLTVIRWIRFMRPTAGDTPPVGR